MSETKFTPGPWYWGGHPGSIRLTAAHSGQRYVMTFERKGMQGAQPLFQPENGMVPADELLKFAVGDRSVTGEAEAKKDESVYRYDVIGIDAPDAHLIAAAPELYEALREVIRTCKAECPAGVPALEAASAALAKARGES